MTISIGWLIVIVVLGFVAASKIEKLEKDYRNLELRVGDLEDLEKDISDLEDFVGKTEHDMNIPPGAEF